MTRRLETGVELLAAASSSSSCELKERKCDDEAEMRIMGVWGRGMSQRRQRFGKLMSLKPQRMDWVGRREGD